MQTVTIYQDGADFYHGGRRIASAPFRVSDSDMAGAIRAREWFKRERVPTLGVNVRFDGE